ncbi:MAG: hypothetical protein ACFFG0_07490 [Candidatus Thorarchaeota archaeon]
MCKKKYLKQGYCNNRIDECLIKFIERINKYTPFKTLASCCGHGKYKPTIVIKDKNNTIFELFTKKILGTRKRNRYYKKDKENYYYIPELIKNEIIHKI